MAPGRTKTVMKASVSIARRSRSAAPLTRAKRGVNIPGWACVTLIPLMKTKRRGLTNVPRVLNAFAPAIV